MYEIERKFKLDSGLQNQVVETLSQRCGAPAILQQMDKVYLIKSDSFATFKRGDPVMRIRQENGAISLTLKQALNEAGDVTELELEVNDAETAHQFVIALGFKLVTHIAKSRLSFKESDFTFAVDEVEGLGGFLEVEILCREEAEIVAAEMRIFEAAGALGVARELLETRKYDVLLTTKAA
jgi:predicted adenylyl cyclase CyaB